MNRRTFFFLGLASTAACSRSSSSSSRPRILASTPPYVTSFPIYVAQEAGYFEAAGLDVILQENPTATTTTALLAGGEVDVGFNAIHPSYLNLIARGARMRYVAGREIATPLCRGRLTLYGAAAAFPNGLNDVTQLAGKRVAVTRQANIGEFSLDSMLAGVGLTAGDLNLSYLREADAAAALVGGHLDAMIASQMEKDLSFLSGKILSGPSLADTLRNFQFSFVLFGQKLLEGDPETGTVFLLAYLKGARDFLEGATADYVDTFAAAHNLDPSLIREGCRQTFTPDGRIDPKSFEQFIEWGIQKGYCDVEVADAELFETRFIDEAVRRFTEMS
jgi:hypothetical protein